MIAGTLALLAAPAIVRAQGATGVALVIGNSKYLWEASLPNVKRDAADVARAFEAVGLRTEIVQDADQGTMLAAIEKFGAAARGARLAALHFAGHGVYWEKQTFVVPADADLGNPAAARTLIAVTSLVQATREAGARLLSFDSCRNSPADGWRQREARGQAQVDAIASAALAATQPNTLLLFSTAPGGVAIDGPAGDNSPYAAALIQQLSKRSVDLQALAVDMRRELLLATECRQLLWDQNSFAAPFAVQSRASVKSVVRYDAGRIVEVPNVYAFARENGLDLPAGLVAYRAAGVSEEQKTRIGSYRHQMYGGGASSEAAGGMIVPGVAIVMSVPDDNTAELVWSFKQWSNAGGKRWRNITASNKDGRLVWLTVDEAIRNDLRWHDANSGTFSQIPNGSGARKRLYSYPFARLDG